MSDNPYTTTTEVTDPTPKESRARRAFDFTWWRYVLATAAVAVAINLEAIAKRIVPGIEDFKVIWLGSAFDAVGIDVTSTMGMVGGIVIVTLSYLLLVLAVYIPLFLWLCRPSGRQERESAA